MPAKKPEPLEEFLTEAMHLSGAMIGAEIAFAHKTRDAKTKSLVHAELRQLSHNGGEVFVNVCGLEDETAGDLDEFQLAPDAQVWVRR